MTLGTLVVEPVEVKEIVVRHENLNTAVDGSVHGYFFGSHKEWEIKLQLLTDEQKQYIESLRGSKFLFGIDDYKCYARFAGNIEWEKVYIKGEWLYSTTLRVVEVVT